MKNIIKLFSLLTLFLVAACAGSISPSSYRVGSAGQINKTIKGVVVAARPVAVMGSERDMKIGAPVGAVLGGLAASEIGGGSKAQAASAVGGALIGGVVGDRLERSITRQGAIEYVIRTDKGGLINVTQGDDIVLGVGQNVYVLLGNPVRVVPVASAPSYSGYRAAPHVPPAYSGYRSAPQPIAPSAYNGYRSAPQPIAPSAYNGYRSAPQTIVPVPSPQESRAYFQYQPQSTAPNAPRLMIP
ncbi:MAG: glycine zipper 2TM domain-containing protein [Alphaproteobacteria bacterium]|nr:glycine zipper 2TM domain-containing protein [Alphaproteobacteria bacterium]